MGRPHRSPAPAAVARCRRAWRDLTAFRRPREAPRVVDRASARRRPSFRRAEHQRKIAPLAPCNPPRSRVGPRGVSPLRPPSPWRRGILSLASSLVLASGCASPEPTEAPTALGESAHRILGGEPDTTHPAVMVVLQDYGDGTAYACSGTMFHVDAARGVGHLLTAAHCLAPPPGMSAQQPASKFHVRQGNDGAASNAIRYSVVRAVAHPAWKDTRDAHDLAVIEVKGVKASTPTLPLVTKLQDEA